MRELDITAELRHPSIVQLLAACLDLPNLCVVLEFADHGSLSRTIHDPGIVLSDSVTLRMLGSIARGMAYLHAKKIVHRDLKPDNVLVFRDWITCKVTDFGESKYAHGGAGLLDPTAARRRTAPTARPPPRAGSSTALPP